MVAVHSTTKLHYYHYHHLHRRRHFHISNSPSTTTIAMFLTALKMCSTRLLTFTQHFPGGSFDKIKATTLQMFTVVVSLADLASYRLAPSDDGLFLLLYSLGLLYQQLQSEHR